jgi:N-acetyl-alpha-D-muramate 1-phosphate uridylyltransferase
MADSLAGIVLGAGAGTRLRPLTLVRPKPLCPVGDTPLVDLAIARVAPVTRDVAVNVHHGRSAMEEHLSGRVHLSVEEPAVLGTAGALGRLRDWIAGRSVVVLNGDAWSPHDVVPLVEGWDGERIRLLVPGGGPLTPSSSIAGALMAWSDVRDLRPEPSGLYEVLWRDADEEGRLEVVAAPEPFLDCGTPARYLEANLAASGGSNVIGRGAVVEGDVTRSVVWPGLHVRPDEVLRDAIRYADGRTVIVR